MTNHSRKIRFGVSASIVSLAIDGLSGLITIKLLAQYLPEAEAGYWVLVMSMGSLLLLLQCGMGPTVAREVAQARVLGEEKLILGSVYRAFLYIFMAVCFSAFVAFFCYLWPAAYRANIEFGSAVAWFPYAIGTAVNLLGQARLYVLNGYGEVGWDKAFRSLCTIAIICSTWMALRMTWGLILLGEIYLCFNLVFWMFAEWKLKNYLGKSIGEYRSQNHLLKKLFRNGSKLLLLNITGYLTTHFTIFIVEQQFGIGDVVRYTAMLKVGVFVGALGGVVPQMLYPYMANRWAASDFIKGRRYYLMGVLSAVSITVFLGLGIYLIRDPFFRIWLGSENTGGDLVLGLILVFYVIYAHHVAHAVATLAVVGNAFILSAILNAVLVLPLSFWLAQVYGLVGVPLGMILGTLPTSAYIVWKSWHTVMGSIPLSAAMARSA